MYTVNYPEKRTFIPFDKEQYLLYLGETPATYVPQAAAIDAGETPDPVNGFSYSGDYPDGGTLIKAKEPSYEAFVSGLIRKRYSADEVEALQANMVETLANKEHPRAEEFAQRWTEFQEYRDECKANARAVLGL
ncbi:hypothetical protein [Alistipes sp.]|uniref:hypothetical protein n=1 Tax=Alistipes sp. TaxID=1872444 RepID=UPI003AF0CCCE